MTIKKAANDNYRASGQAMMQESCVVASVEFGVFDGTRRLDWTKIETDADKRRIRGSKKIMESENLAKIHSIWRKTYNWLWTKALPAPLRSGMYLIPTELIEEVENKFRAAEAEAAPFVEALIAELPRLKTQDKRDLKSQYRESDYPTEQDLRDSFYIAAQYIDFQVPDKLRNISTQFYSREVVKMTKAWEETEENIIAFLGEMAVELIDQFANQLKIDGDGKKGRIYDSTIAKLREFARDFPTRNVVRGNDRMMVIVARAGKLLDSVDFEELRNNDALRKQVSDEFNGVQADMNGLMKRRIRRIDVV